MQLCKPQVEKLANLSQGPVADIRGTTPAGCNYRKALSVRRCIGILLQKVNLAESTS